MKHTKIVLFQNFVIMFHNATEKPSKSLFFGFLGGYNQVSRWEIPHPNRIKKQEETVMKKLLLIVLTLAMAFTFVSAASAAEFTIKLCHEQVDGDPIDQGCDRWAELIAEKTNGAVVMEVYPSSQLGIKKDLIEMMLMGQPVCTIADGSYLMDYVPDFGVVMGPFLFTDWASMYKITASDWWAEQAEKLRAEGLEIVSTNWIYGERQLMTKTPVRSVADLKGMKIRVPNNDISVKMFNNLGGASTPMALSEVYTSLQQGVVDGVENPLTTLYNNAFQEVCKNVTITNHQMTFSNWIVGADFWAQLPEEYQKAVLEAGEEAALFNNEAYAKVSEQMESALKEAGCEIITLDDAALEEFKSMSVALYDEYEKAGTWTPGVYQKIQDIIAQ